MPQRVIFPARAEVSLEAFELPSLGENDIEVRALYSLMSIGTETTILNQRYAPDTHFARMFSFPQLQTGVQTVGEVREVGAQVSEFAVEDVVYLRCGHGSHHVVDAGDCSPIPRTVDLKQASWCGLAKTAFRAAWEGDFGRGGTVLIIGAGPVGQMCLRWARASDMESIVVCDLSETRLQHATRGGATGIHCGDVSEFQDEIGSMKDGKGPEVVVDSTGNPGVFHSALAAAARFGKVILLGDTGYPGRQCLSSEVMTKGLTVVATHDSHDRAGWTQGRVDRLFFALVGEGKFCLDGLITHEFSPADCARAYALANDDREHAMGILFDWTGQEW